MVGAGPVGLLLANLLGQQNIRTLIVEKRSTPLDASMAIGVTPPSLEILKRLDLDTAFMEAGVRVRHAEVYESGRRLGRLTFDELPSDYRFFLSIPQASTVQILRANAGKFPCINMGCPVQFAKLEQDGQGVTAYLQQSGQKEMLRLRAAFLVGCDGHRSAVRDAVAVPVRESIYPQQFVMADFPDDSALGTEARLFFSPEASVESFPLPGGWRRWIVLVRPPCTEPIAQYLVRTVRQLTGFDLSGHSPRFVSEFGAKRMVAERYFRGRVLLAGDAAHVMSSIGGQGMNTGFADAEFLASLLPRLLKGEATMQTAFETYDSLRRRAYEVAARRAEQGMWLGTLHGRLASAFRKVVIRDLLFSPLIQPRLAPHFAMLTIPFRNLYNVPSHALASC